MNSRHTSGNKPLIARWLAVCGVVGAVGALIVLALGCTVRARAPQAKPTPTHPAVPQETRQPVRVSSIELANRDVRQGDEVLVVGQGWPGGATIVIELVPIFSTDDRAQTVATVSVTDGGRFEIAFAFPTDARWEGAAGAIVRAWYPVTGQDTVAVLRLASGDGTSEPTATPTPSPPATDPTPAPTDVAPQPEPTAPQEIPTALCSDKAAFIADVTIPDNAYMQPGQSFVKTWRLRNSGTCTWTTGYALVYAGGHRMGGAAAVPLGTPVAPGSTVDLSITLVAPSENGFFDGRWQLRSPEGRLFGTGASANRPVWVRVNVGPTPVPTPVISRWRGEYYSNRNLTGSPALVRDDTAVSFDWGAASPMAGLAADGFSARWTRTLSFEPVTYRFYVLSDDGARVWLDGQLIIDEWHAATGNTHAGDRTLSAGVHTLRVEYYENTGAARIQFWWERITDSGKWRAEYFTNPGLSGAPKLTRDDAAINFDWASGAPAAGLPTDGFSARWTRTTWFDVGQYRFHALIDDGARLYVDGVLIIDAWGDGGRRPVTGEVALASGYHTVRVEYYERSGDALIQLRWETVTSFPDWRGEYWANRSLSGGPVLVRNDVHIDFSWKSGAPSAALPADGFSARWTRDANFEAGTYRFRVTVDDGARLWVDDRLIIDSWRDGSPRELTAEHALAAGKHQVRLEYYENAGEARIRLSWEKVAAPTFPDWKGEYWPNRKLDGSPALVRNDKAIDFAWGTGSAAAGLPADSFSARWARTLDFEAGVYRFQARADDGVRLFLGGELVLDKWQDSAGDTTYKVDVPVPGGHHKIRVEYYDRAGQALVKVWWKRVGDLPTPTPVPNRAPVAVDDAATTDQGTPVTLNVLANDTDADGDALAITGLSATSTEGATVSCTGAGWCTYTPLLAFYGSDRFTYVVSDGKGGASTGTVTVQVSKMEVNQPPTATDDSATTRQDAAVTMDVLENDSDPDADQLEISAFDATTLKGGEADCTTAGMCTYTPRAGFSGTDRFRYEASDGQGGTDVGTVTIRVQRTAGIPQGVMISELMPLPAAVDGEWIELYNGESAAIDLGGWYLDDGEGGSDPYRIPDGTLIEAGGFLVLYETTTGIALDDTGDEVRLLRTDGTLADWVAYEGLPLNASYSRDAEGIWHADWPPSPRAPNLPSSASLRASSRIQSERMVRQAAIRR